MKLLKKVIILGLVFVLGSTMLFSFTGCGVNIQANNLMEGIEANTITGKEIDERFIDNASRFSIDIFKKSINDGNSLVSPLSVMLALSMTANGADNETLTQMEKVLGDDMTIDDLNNYLYTYAKGLPNKEKSKFEISNSIWFRDENSFKVEQSFLQKNADYYNADAYKSAFDKQTVSDINSWVKDRTDGMIDKILDEIDADSLMYLINAIVFDAEWENIYTKESVNKREFTNIDGSKVNVDMMASDESKFISGDKEQGFIKPYKNGDYRFVAILPDESISINDYVEALTGEYFISLIEGAENSGVKAYLPKFSYDYRVTMNDALMNMGMVEAFDGSADFSKIGKSDEGNIFISEVLHKTFISVDERGTKAGAVTSVEMKTTGMLMDTVVLDRPFVYAIIDNATSLPIFIGTVVELSE